MIKFTKGRFLLMVLAAPLFSVTAHANLYITNLRMNGAVLLTNSAAITNINITYILNEPATQGVAVQIFSGGNLLRTIMAAPGTQGALFGSNDVVWNSTDSNGVPVPTGHYGVSIAAIGGSHTTWTQISQDAAPGNYTHDPRGLAVNNNSNSFYYGRVFVANAHQSLAVPPSTLPGDQDTIIKLNADGSFAYEGPDGDGGYPMIDLGDYGVPQKLRVASDDRLYMMDFDSQQLAAFDMLLSTNEIVLNPNNYEYNPFGLEGSLSTNEWFSMDVTGADTTHGLIWLGAMAADGAGTNVPGIWNWNIVNGVADPTNDTGNWVVEVGRSLGSGASGGFMVDTNFDIFVGQYLTDTADTNDACLEFPHWNHGLSSGGEPVSNGVAWNVGGSDSTFLGVYDTTIDSRAHPNYVACALNSGPDGGIRILNAQTGAVLVTNLDETNQYYATAWDNVGNLYGASATSHLLRVFSPPITTNQASISGELQIVPAITSVTLDGTTLTIYFIGTASDQVSQIGLQACPSLNGEFVDVTTGVSVLLISPGYFQLTTTVSAPIQFYRIRDTGGH